METTLSTQRMVRPRRAVNTRQEKNPSYIFVSSDEKLGWLYWCEGTEPRFRLIENFDISSVGDSYSIIKMADLVPLLPV